MHRVREVRLSDWQRLTSAPFDNIESWRRNKSLQVWSGEKACLVEYLRYEVFLPVGHNVDPCDTRNLLDLLDHLDADALALGPRPLSRSEQPSNNGVRDYDAGNILSHPIRDPRRPERSNADEDKHALVESHVYNTLHKRPQTRNIEAVLCLNEVRSRLDLLL